MMRDITRTSSPNQMSIARRHQQAKMLFGNSRLKGMRVRGAHALLGSDHLFVYNRRSNTDHALGAIKRFNG